MKKFKKSAIFRIFNKIKKKHLKIHKYINMVAMLGTFQIFIERSKQNKKEFKIFQKKRMIKKRKITKKVLI